MDAGLVVAILLAIAFAATNGLHDASNAIATLVATRAATPLQAILLASVFNMLGPLLLGAAVADTIGGIVSVAPSAATAVIGAGLLGAILWNLVTWRLGLPSSSSHALIGGLIGGAIAAGGTGAVDWGGLWTKVIVPALQSPVIGFFIAAIVMVLILRAFFRVRPAPLNRSFRVLQIGSGSLMAFLHGTNDAQKTMGVMALALFTTHHIDTFYIPWYVKVSAGLALGAGTYVGGWRIMRTMGTRIFKLEPPQGFAAQTTASLVLWYTARSGFPISTTQVVSGSVMGAGATTK